MANYDNSRYTYNQILNSKNLYYQRDDMFRYSDGVLTMQERLNKAGFWCGVPDGKFGGDTEEAVLHIQRAFGLVADGLAGCNTLFSIDRASERSPGFTKTSGTYGVYFDTTNKKFMHNQQTVLQALRAAGFNNYAIAGFMGNLEAEHQFKTSLVGTGGAIGLAQWEGTRKANLLRYATANSTDNTSIVLQAWFIVEECTSGSGYEDSGAVNCMRLLKNNSAINSASKAADYVTALYERCANYPTWSGVQGSGYSTSRFSQNPNAYNQRYYLDTPKRRGYAEAYYSCICQM